MAANWRPCRIWHREPYCARLRLCNRLYENSSCLARVQTSCRQTESSLMPRQFILRIIWNNLKHFSGGTYCRITKILIWLKFKAPPMYHVLFHISFSSTDPRWFRTTGGVWIIHDDVIQCKRFARYWAFAQGIHRPPVNSPHKGQ